MSNENLSVSPPPSKELSDEVLTEYTFHGKPVFCRVIEATTPNKNSNTKIFSLDSTKIQIISFNGLIKNNTDNYTHISINYNDNSTLCRTTIGKTGIYMQPTYAECQNKPCYITIYYTKK